MKNYEDSQPDKQATEIEPGTQPKKPYHKPARRREQVFETSALHCGKIAGTQGQCNSFKKTS